MMGAMARVMEFVAVEDIMEICEHALGRKYPKAMEGNLEGIRRGYDEVTIYECSALRNEKKSKENEDEKEQDVSRKYQQGKTGYQNMTIGGLNLNFGNSVTNDLSPSRQGFIPLFLQDKCINCGLCDSTCPDMVFQFEPGEYKDRKMMVNRGLDYFHCKGCLRCVEVCPTGALVKGLESDYDTKPWFVPNKELIRVPDYYEKSGADGFITSESYLTEKRIEGGEV